jgi:hypothetical protein
LKRLVDSDGYKRLVEVSAKTLLAGKKRKLWDETDPDWEGIPDQTPIDDVTGLLVEGIGSKPPTGTSVRFSNRQKE